VYAVLSRISGSHSRPDDSGYRGSTPKVPKLQLTDIQLRFIPCAVSGALCNVFVGVLAPYVKGQVLFALGCVGTIIANILFALRPIGASYWKFEFWSMTLIVFGADFSRSF
jgi:nitrate/nitrite transporter NarK